MPLIDLELKLFAREQLNVQNIEFEVLKHIGDELKKVEVPSTEPSKVHEFLEEYAKKILHELPSEVEVIELRTTLNSVHIHIGMSRFRSVSSQAIKLIAPKPSRILRVGVVEVQETFTPYLETPVPNWKSDSISWLDLSSKEYYVYESIVQSNSTNKALVIVTEDTETLIIPTPKSTATSVSRVTTKVTEKKIRKAKKRKKRKRKSRKSKSKKK